MKRNLALVILVGGRARRLGGVDKARLEVEGRPLVRRLVETLRPREVVLAGAPPRAYADLGLPSVPDAFPGAGPVAGLAAGLEAVQAPAAFVCACDMPRVRPEVVDRIASRLGRAQAAACRLKGRPQPLHAVYRRACAGKAREYLARGCRAAGGFLESLECRWLEEEDLADLAGWEESFVNLNTPEDLEGT